MRIPSNPFRALAALGLVALTVALVACGGGGDDNGGSSANASGGGTSTQSGTGSAVGSGNTVPIVVNAGLANVVNMPTVAVTVCAPGTSTCQVISNVLLDTASYGLRLVNTAAANVLGSLPKATASNGGALTECGQFVSSYTWGSVRTADIKLAGLTASSVPLQIIGDLGTSNVPTDCSNGSTSANTVNALGANGILGVGPSPLDCGSACVSAASNSNYYSCPASGSCAQTTVPLANQVANPVSRLPSNNDGVIVQLNAPSNGTATGTLTLGVGTLPGSVTKLATTTAGNLTGTFQGRTITSAFFDSGSNAYFFDTSDSATLPTCSQSTSFYCPAATVSLSASLTASGGATSLTVPFSVANAQNLFNSSNFALANLGGPFGGSRTLDLGLPHFFGRSIYFGIDQRLVGGTQTPYVAL
ncbi:DUF3443 domain-containing protein [Burkholderia sp. Ac-20379]|uniref:DUF3443 domain-containing protein n=1 Tax=Burkholderia sp. Ac-20379 TaxID=2703900 RepID=UPI001DD63C00|nr:DUF3443 domain-containing protein [Burkholderia sp. Ac-20379]MBN3727920.1 DUF3443 domain-containing protein [Burkholderia sp. Ac-20379]